jgi:hypothetical protein
VPHAGAAHLDARVVERQVLARDLIDQEATRREPQLVHGAERAQDLIGVVLVVVGQRAEVADRDETGRHGGRGRDLLEVDQIDDVKRGLILRVTLQLDLAAGR